MIICDIDFLIFKKRNKKINYLNSQQHYYVIEIEVIKFMEKLCFADGVNLVKINNKFYCINNAYNNDQVFGNILLKNNYDLINTGRTNDADKELVNILAKKNFLVINRNKYEARNIIKSHQNWLKNASLKFTLLRILLTDLCNMQCDYCKVVNINDKPSIEPTSLDRIKEVIRFFFENSTLSESKIIHITGGEPTLYFEHIEAIIKYINIYKRENENYWIVMGTNALKLNDNIIEFIAKNNIKCIVSMDGFKHNHDILRRDIKDNGTWDYINNNIMRLKEKKIEFSISMVIGKHNIDEIEQIIEFYIHKYKIKALGVNFMKPPNIKKNNYEYFVDEKEYSNTIYNMHKKFRSYGLFLELLYRHLDPFVNKYFRFHDCGAAGGVNLNISTNNKIGPCKSFLILEDFAMSELDIKEYEKIIIKQWGNRSPIYNKKCLRCSAIAVCGNGCAYEAYCRTGSAMGIDERSCEYSRHFYELFLQDLLQLIKSNMSNLNWWYYPNENDRNKMLGSVKEEQSTLRYSIGHAIRKYEI